MGFLTAWEGEQLLRDYGFPVISSELVKSKAEAIAAARSIGFPVVLKYVSNEIIHKTEAGVIALDVPDEDRLVHEFDRICENAKQYVGGEVAGAVLVQRKIPEGMELIVGVKRDSLFGHFLLVGMGGVFVEVLRDVSVRKMPVSYPVFTEMIKELKAYPIFQGMRTGITLDIGLVFDLVQKLNRLVDLLPELEELDLNPAVVSQEEVLLCDVRMIVGEKVPQPSTSKRKTDDLRRLLHPESIAVVGASNQLQKNGGRLFRYIIENGFSGSVYPVHPTQKEVQGRRAYPSVSDIPDQVDVVCVIVPAQGVLQVLQSCAEKNVRIVIVFSSGFSEVGPKGQALQNEICRYAKEHGIHLVGPNSLGFISPKDHVFTAFGGVLESNYKLPGSIAFISQSGAIGSALLSRAWEQGVGFSRWVSVGNEADLTVADFMELFIEDEETKVISIFMESIKDFYGFSQAARRAKERNKQIVVFKTGRSTIGQRAVQTHTGSIAGDAQLYNEVFRDLGLVCVRDLQSLIDVSWALVTQPIPKGNRVGVVTASGGACSVIADLCDQEGLELMQSRSLESAVTPFIPPFGSAKNPIDVTAEVISNPEMFKQVVNTVLECNEIDSILVMLTTNADPGAAIVAKGIIEVFEKHDKPVIVGRLGGDSIAPEAMNIYRSAGFPIYSMPHQVVSVVSALTSVMKGEEVCLAGMQSGVSPSF